ncbi:MAG: hypothetical protein GVY15_08135 [Bacteroidetes bacterium]|jgi:uncharacterized protein (TIGR00290 family)|nr:hypothetical protein [Bacteroidota bacterium]
MKNVAVLWSGGKDAMQTLHTLRQDASVQVTALVATFWTPELVITMHGTPAALIAAQAEALGVPLHRMTQPRGASNAVYEARLQKTLAPLIDVGVTHVAAGDLHLADVRDYRAGLLQRIGVTPLFPLWDSSSTACAEAFLAAGYAATICSVDPDRLKASWLGAPYDDAFLKALPPEVDPCGEYGAFHTFVHDGPLFTQPVPFTRGAAYDEGPMRAIGLDLAADENERAA